jgi:small-conductance mechanosensitive channel
MAFLRRCWNVPRNNDDNQGKPVAGLGKAGVGRGGYDSLTQAMDGLNEISGNIWQAMHDQHIMLQLLAIALCTAASWLVAKLLRAQFTSDTQPPGVGSFARVLTPLLTLILINLVRHWFFKGTGLHGNLLHIVVPLVASLALMRFGFYLVRRIFVSARLSNTLSVMERLFAIVVWAGGLLYISGLWPDLLAWLDDTTLPLGRNKVSLATILQAAASILVMLTLAMWAGAVLEQRLMQMEVMQTSLRVVLARTARALLVFLGLLLSLAIVGIDLTVLSVFGGALGVGLGLGLQKIASNYVSGFVILLDGSLKIGDMIIVEKYTGKVTQINARYTILQGLDGIESVLPNELLVSGPVQNYSLTNSSIRLATRISVPFGTDLDSLFPLLEAAAGLIPRILPDPAPQAMLIKVSGDGLELELGFWINDPQNGRGGVTSDVNRAICRVLQQQGIVLQPLQVALAVAASSVAAAATLS